MSYFDLCYARKEDLFCSVGTGEDVDLEVLVDDFVCFYMAGIAKPYKLHVSLDVSSVIITLV